MLADELIKALIIDEGSIGDKIVIELGNKKLAEDMYEIIKQHYKLTKLFSRTRKVYFKENSSWNHIFSSYGFGFSSESFENLYKSISQLPIDYKQANLEFLYKLKTCHSNHKKHSETKKLIIQSLLNEPKTLNELAKEIGIKQTSTSVHIKNLPIIIKVDEKILRRGGYAKVNIFGIKDIQKAQEFLAKKIHYTRRPRLP